MSERTANNEGRAPAHKRESAPQQNREHLESLLDRALADTFPASDPVSSLQPDPSPAQPSRHERSSGNNHAVPSGKT